ncbi:MAG TPA: hypothetical protein VFU43_00045 [Streptosporangiaceae bacterium]|nr:hypothetical protein [Streptosporangiaceae bacterium]
MTAARPHTESSVTSPGSSAGPLRVVQWSGGIGSWAAAQRVAAAHGTRRMVLLFANVLVEHPDLYRFSRQAADQLGVPVTRVCDGRTPWQLFGEVRFLGNSRIAPCSHLLKQVPCRTWLEHVTAPDAAILYVGIGVFEEHRTTSIERGWAPWRVEFPMCHEPYLSHDDMLDWARDLGMRPPLLYEPPYSLQHNNCGGFCVRTGIRQWSRMLELDPAGYSQAELHEQRLRAELGDVAILRDRSGGGSRPLPLTELPRDWSGRLNTTHDGVWAVVYVRHILGGDRRRGHGAGGGLHGSGGLGGLPSRPSQREAGGLRGVVGDSALGDGRRVARPS